MRLTPGHKLAPPEPPSIAPSLPTSQHSASRATSLRVGGPARPTQVSYRGNGSKDQGPCTSAIWRIFLVAKALPAVANFAELRHGEVRRIHLLETVWKVGWRGVNEARSLACNAKIRSPCPSMLACVAPVWCPSGLSRQSLEVEFSEVHLQDRAWNALPEERECLLRALPPCGRGLHVVVL